MTESDFVLEAVPYERERAVKYAERWARRRNPLFYDFMTQNVGVGPFGREVMREEAEVGDVVQLYNGERFYHTLLITDIRRGQIYVSAHSYDALDRPLDSYTYVSDRFIHLEGVRRDPRLTPIDCFSVLYDQPEDRSR